MKEKLQTIVENLMCNNNSWLFDQNGIVVKDKGDFWILNYCQYAPKNEYNILTRGLVVSKNARIVSCPFFRFFNFGEPLAAKVNFANSELLEKLDGSFVGICFPDGNLKNPLWHFRSLMSSYKKDLDFAIKGFVFNEEYPLLKKVEPYVRTIDFSKKPELCEYTLMFEFISSVNPVVTKYGENRYGLHLIGARHLPTLQEMTENELDALAFELNVPRPRRWDIKSYDEILAMMANFPADYEGFVSRDRETGDRNKIKSEDYLRRHRLLNRLNYKTLIPLWFSGERDEIQAYFAQSKAIFDNIEACFNKTAQDAYDCLTYWRSKNCSRKEVALGMIPVTPHHICALVFRHLESQGDLRKGIEDTIKKTSIDTLIEVWKIREIEDVSSYELVA